MGYLGLLLNCSEHCLGKVSFRKDLKLTQNLPKYNVIASTNVFFFTQLYLEYFTIYNSRIYINRPIWCTRQFIGQTHVESKNINQERHEITVNDTETVNHSSHRINIVISVQSMLLNSTDMCKVSFPPKTRK